MSEPNHTIIYNSEAEQYDQLISAQPSLMEWIKRVRDPHGLSVIDLGAGTGRLTLPLAACTDRLLAVDLSPAMLEVTASKLRAAGFQGWRTEVSDHRTIPAPDCSADLLVSGWSICYSANTDADPNGQVLSEIMAEIRRVLRPGGTVILFETMGTGSEEPSPPSFLLPYYEALVRDYRFTESILPLPYTFASPAEAESLSRFFFGDNVGDAVAAHSSSVIPEFAGMWWRQYD